MAICKFCGQESGGTKFCQNCGANLDDNQMNQSSIPMMNSSIPQPPFTTAQVPNTMNQPWNQPQSTYTPGSHADLYKKSLIVLFLSILLACSMVGIFSLILSALALSTCGRIPQAKSQEEEENYRDTASNYLRIATVLLVVGFGLIVFAARMH